MDLTLATLIPDCPALTSDIFAILLDYYPRTDYLPKA
jgi:hypothetical protein